MLMFLSDCIFNCRQDSVEMRENFVICKTYDGESPLPQLIFTEEVAVFLRQVNASINFQDQLVFPTEKIDDVDIDGNLASKFQVSKSPVSQNFP